MVSLVGIDCKETIIYKFEFLATCLVLDVWSPVPTSAYSAGYYITYGDNDRVCFAQMKILKRQVTANHQPQPRIIDHCFALSRGTGFGIVAATIIHMKLDQRTQLFSIYMFGLRSASNGKFG